MPEELNAIERVNRVLSGQLPDRVPVDLHNFMVTARMMAVDNYEDFFRDGEAMAEGQIAAWRRFGHDVLLVENGTAALAEACGVQVVYQEKSAPVAVAPAINSLDDIDKLEIPDPDRVPVLAENLKATRIVCEEIGDQAFIMGRADQGPFSLASELRGMTFFMMDLAIGDERIHHLLDYATQVCKRYALAQMEQGAHCTSIGDSPSGPDLISPEMYRRYAYPYVKRLVAELQAEGVPLAYHICGNATPIIEDMVSTGAAIIEIDQKADMAACKQATAGTNAALLGPVDPSAVLAHGSPADVTAACREAINILGPGGGFILGPGCAMPASTPDENIDALIEAAKEYGQYPL
jgi:uroporphyrinogen decarboxylase